MRAIAVSREPSSARESAREDDALVSALARISERNVAVVHHARPSVRESLRATNLREQFARSPAFERKCVLGADASAEATRAALLADVPNATALCEDIAAVIRAFAAVVPRAPNERVLVNLSLLRETLCSRYHVNHTSARCMVSYFGAGTECLDERTSAVIAAANANGGNVVSDALKKLAETFVTPVSVDECDVCLLKGERWQYDDESTSRGKALVHRSPNIDPALGEWRLTLKLDVESFGAPCACGHEHDPSFSD